MRCFFLASLRPRHWLFATLFSLDCRRQRKLVENRPTGFQHYLLAVETKEGFFDQTFVAAGRWLVGQRKNACEDSRFAPRSRKQEPCNRKESRGRNFTRRKLPKPVAHAAAGFFLWLSRITGWCLTERRTTKRRAPNHELPQAPSPLSHTFGSNASYTKRAADALASPCR